MTEDERKLFSVRPGLDSSLGRPNKIRAYYQVAREGFRMLAGKYGRRAVVIADPVDMWAGIGETVYLDEIHTNDRGNEIVAQRLSTLIRALEND